MPTVATACLYTTVRNISGVPQVFGYLGRHGMRLLPGQQVSVPGDLRMTLAAHPNMGARKFAALESSIAAGKVMITSTPSPMFLDIVRDNVKMLRVATGAVGLVDPCWGSYHSG